MKLQRATSEFPFHSIHQRFGRVGIFVQVAAWAVLVCSGTMISHAQDAAPQTGSPAQSDASAATGQRSDGQIEMDVVQALDAETTLKDDMITAATIQGEVTLAGTVSSASSKDLAGSIVSKVKGVTQVHNNLKIGVPTEQDPSAQDSPGQAAADNGNAQSQPMSSDQAPSPDQAPASQTQRPQYAQNPPRANANHSAPPSYPAQGAYRDENQGPPPPYPSSEADRSGPGRYESGRSESERSEPARMATGPVTIPPGTLLQVRTNEGLDNKRAEDGTVIELTLIHDVNVAGSLGIPRGATLHGVVTESKKSGELGGSPVLALQLTSLDLDGQSYPLTTDTFQVKGPNKSGSTARNIFGGAVLGAIVGGAVGRGPGAAIGAAAGAGAGTAASAASSGPNVWIPAEALVVFHLAAPITVNPVSRQEAQRLAEGLYPGGPALYHRGGPPGGPQGYPYPPPPPPYYRPYYMTGGYYYWR